MENNYIQQLRQILLADYQVSAEEIENIIDDYRLTVETIVDETGDEKAVVDQLGDPRMLAEEIAKEFKFTKRIKLENQEHSETKNFFTPSDISFSDILKKVNSALPGWAKILLLVLISICIAVPIVGAIGGLTIGGIVAGVGLVIAGVVLSSEFFTISPWFIIMLFVAGITTLVFVFFMFSAMVKGIVYFVQKFFGTVKNNEKPRKKWKIWAASILFIVVLISHGSLFAIVATTNGLRDKLPYNMYMFRLRNFGIMSVEKKDIDQKEIQKLVLKGSGASFDLTESSDDKYHVTTYKNGKEIKNVVVVENGELKVNLESQNNCFMCIDFGGGPTVKVEVPKNAKHESIYLEIRGGEANLKNVAAKQMDISITGGSTYGSSVEAENLKVTVTGGESKFEEVNTTTANFYVSGGSIDIKRLKADLGLFDVRGGSIDIRKGEIGRIEKNIKGGSVDIG